MAPGIARDTYYSVYDYIIYALLGEKQSTLKTANRWNEADVTTEKMWSCCD